MFILGIIPARKNSKGIKLKNLYSLCGKPLIDYTIDAVRQSNLDDYILTTDSEDIAQYCNRVIMRPPELAQDDTPMLPVIQHVVEKYSKHVDYVDAIMILQPTSPLRTTEDINSAISQYNNNPTDSLVSVCKGIHPMKSYDMDGNPFMEQIPYRKQKHGCYTRNGAIFICSRKLLDSGRLFSDRPELYVMPKVRSIDVDDWEDLMMVEALLKKYEYERPPYVRSHLEMAEAILKLQGGLW